MRSTCLFLIAAGLGCASPAELEGAVVSDGPLLGAADSGDRADRQCRVRLRDATPSEESLCRDGACFYAWTLRIDVANAWATTEPEVGVLYHVASDDGAPWLEVRGARQLERGAQFTTYELVIGEQTVEAGEALDDLELELAPFLASDGRLFDKNSLEGDLDNYVLDASNDFRVEDDGTCAGAGNIAMIHFTSDWSELVEGRLVTSGNLLVSYDHDRLTTCRGTHNGHRGWDITAHARFYPGGEYNTASVVTQNGGFYVPNDAEWVDMWFTNTSIDCRGEVAYDSNFGENYGFAIARP